MSENVEKLLKTHKLLQMFFTTKVLCACRMWNKYIIKEQTLLHFFVINIRILIISRSKLDINNYY